MAISVHTEVFAGRPVVDWDAQSGLADPAGTIPRLSLSYDESDKKITWPDKFAEFLKHPDAATATGLVIGTWDWDFGDGSSSHVVDALAGASEKLPLVTAIFMGDITYEENELSWIKQSDVTPILKAFQRLEQFTVRGGDGLRLGGIHHEGLKQLCIQTGGMDAQIVRAVSTSQLPNLEHLELWLGTEDYGATVTLEDLQPLLGGGIFPSLRYLGLRDSHIADAIAVAASNAPVLGVIDVLDLSLGTLSDEGAEALLASPKVARLKKLDVHHHYCSPEVVAQLEALPIEVNASEVQTAEDDDDWRYVAHGE